MAYGNPSSCTLIAEHLVWFGACNGDAFQHQKDLRRFVKEQAIGQEMNVRMELCRNRSFKATSHVALPSQMTDNQRR